MDKVMMFSDLRCQKVVATIATSFLSEGYVLVLKSVSVSFMFYKLKHTRNGNEILVKGYPKDNFYVILRNGKQVKRDKIIDLGKYEVHKS